MFGCKYLTRLLPNFIPCNIVLSGSETTVVAVDGVAEGYSLLLFKCAMSSLVELTGIPHLAVEVIRIHTLSACDVQFFTIGNNLVILCERTVQLNCMEQYFELH